MFETGKLGLTERKLAAVEELLAIAQQEIAVLVRQRDDWKASHRLQARNTGAFWDSTRKAEKKLARVRELVDGELGSLVFLEESIREVLDGE